MIYFFFCYLTFLLQAIETLEVQGTRSFHEQTSINNWEQHESFFSQNVNLNFSSGANRSRFFQIRGIGDYSQFDNFNQSQVGYFYNGIDLSEEPQALLNTSQQQRLIYRSSESIQYGSKGLGGLIEINSCPLDLCITPLIETTLASQNTQSMTISAPFKISKHWASSFRIQKLLSDGFQKNQYLNKMTGKRDEFYIDWEQQIQSDMWSISIQSLFTRHKNGYDHFSHNNSLETQSDRPGLENLTTHGHSIHFKQHFEKDLEFKLLGSLTSTSYDQSFDEDWGNNDFWNQVPGWFQNYDYSSSNTSKRLKTHQRVILRNQKFELGLHLYQNKEKINNTGFKERLVRKNITGKTNQDIAALTGRYHLIKNTTQQWTPEVRIENQKLSLETLENKRIQKTLWTARSTNIFKINTRSEFILKVGKSFRGGGFNLESAATDARRTFDEESLYFTDLEFKRVFSFGSQHLNFFGHLREDQQLRTSFQDDPLDPSSFTTITKNIGSSKAYGLEVQQNFNFSFLKSSIQLGFLYSKFKDYQTLTGNLKGRQTPYAPRYSFLVSNQFIFTENSNLNLSYYGKDAFYFSNTHDFKSTSFQLFDLSFQYKTSHWDINVFCQNLFNTAYAQRGFYFSNEPPDWEKTLYTQQSPTRSYGISISYLF